MPLLDKRELNSAIRAMLRAGYNPPHIRETLKTSTTRIAQNYEHLSETGIIEKTEHIGRIQPSTIQRCETSWRQYSTALSLYTQLRTEPTLHSPVDVVALVRAYTFVSASLLDNDMQVKFCINRLYKTACWLEVGRIVLRPSNAGTALFVESESQDA